ncbi:hypothetical protein D9757_008287 [Collybiopsis confluens]|uniref:G-patch domain-containing protein n=1 Tax=Collybiopsis confluens TaxID=2823264 RepID=A0A8H5M0W6_9AGAR|nr:hypothetical protein D9757_008287 [Collybiopsis confluens]
MISRQQTKNSEQPKYRDRALERRALFNQPDSPLPENDNSKVPKRKQVEGPPPPPPAPLNPGQDGANVGNKLLKMMGWQEGMGLGANGEGRVDPMYQLMDHTSAFDIVNIFPLSSKTTIYAEGAGLGASKGKDVGKFNEGHGGYLSMAQESVSCT